MSQLASFDLFLQELNGTTPDVKPEKEADNRPRVYSTIDELIDGFAQQQVARNQRNHEFAVESLQRTNPLTAGNEFGGVLTGLANAGASIAAPLVRTVSGDGADWIQGQSSALMEAQQRNVQENVDSGRLGNTPYLGAARQFVNEQLPGAVSSLTQSAGLAASGGTAGLVAGFGAGAADQSYYEGRQAGLSKADAALYGARDAVAETLPMLVFQGLGKAVPALSGVEGLFTNPKNAQTIAGIVKNTAIGLGAEGIEESITTVGQLTNKAASIPGSEDAANWYGTDGEFLSETAPMRPALVDTWKQTFATMGLGKAIQLATNPEDRKSVLDFAANASRRTYAGLTKPVKAAVDRMFPNALGAQPDRQAAAAAVTEALSAEDQAAEAEIKSTMRSTDELAAGQPADATGPINMKFQNREEADAWIATGPIDMKFQNREEADAWIATGPIDMTFQNRKEADAWIAKNGEKVESVTDQGEGVTQIVLRPEQAPDASAAVPPAVIPTNQLPTPPVPLEVNTEPPVETSAVPDVSQGVPPSAGLVVANIGANGQVYYGEPGDIHGELTYRYPDATPWQSQGFAGPDGKFLTREEALATLPPNSIKSSYSQNAGELDALDYQDFQAQQQNSPVQPQAETGSMPGGQQAQEIEVIPQTQEPTASQPPAVQPEAPGQLLQRFEEPGVARASFDKPHGIYTSPGDVESPHSDLGGQRYVWRRNKDANVLDVSDVTDAAMRRGTDSFGAGVAAAKKLLGEKAFDSLRHLGRKGLAAEAAKMFPSTDFNGYYDSQEVMEAIGALVAKERGYDAIETVDRDPRWSEYVGLTERSMTPEAPEGELSIQPIFQTTEKTGENFSPTTEIEQQSGPTREQLIAMPRPVLQKMAADAGLKMAGKNSDVIVDAIIEAREAAAGMRGTDGQATGELRSSERPGVSPENLAESRSNPQNLAESRSNPQNLPESPSNPQNLPESPRNPQNLPESPRNPQEPSQRPEWIDGETEKDLTATVSTKPVFGMAPESELPPEVVRAAEKRKIPLDSVRKKDGRFASFIAERNLGEFEYYDVLTGEHFMVQGKPGPSGRPDESDVPLSVLAKTESEPGPSQSDPAAVPAGYQPLAEFTPAVFESKSPDLELEDNKRDMKADGFKSGDVVGYRVYPTKNSNKGAYWQYGNILDVSESHARVKRSDGAVVESIGASRLQRLKPAENDADTRKEPSDSDKELDAHDFIKAVLNNKTLKVKDADEAWTMYRSNTGVATGRLPESHIFGEKKFKADFGTFQHHLQKAAQADLSITDKPQTDLSDDAARLKIRNEFRQKLQDDQVATTPDGTEYRLIPDPVNAGAYTVEATKDGVVRKVGEDQEFSMRGAWAKALEDADLFAKTTVPAVAAPESLKRGDRFKDTDGNEFEVWKHRQGTLEAHPVVNGNPVVNNKSTVRFSTSEPAKVRNPEDRTNFATTQAIAPEPSATEHDRLYKELQPLYRDPKHGAGDRDHLKRIRELEQQVEFHKPAAVARAQAEIDAEKPQAKPPETLDELLQQFQNSTSEIDKAKSTALGVLVRGVAKYRGISPDEYVKQRFEGVVSGGTPAEGALFARASSRLAAKLESGKKVKVYRAMQLIDGKLYPPMAAKVDGKLVEPTEIGTWEVADERPDLVRGGKFKLDKANGSVVPARYNPYFHTSRSPLNDQFSSAYKRDNLVTVEVEVPESELTSGYRADGAKDAVGEIAWNAGPVSSKLPSGKKRKVILSRYAKVLRIVPDSEVAGVIATMLKGEGITFPTNVVTPSLRKELEKIGVTITETLNKTQDGVVKASVEFNNDARALIRALNATNVADMIHELGHIFRRDLSEADLVTVEKWAGVSDGTWTEAAEEKWATGFERYLAEGKAPTPALKGVFAQFKEWLADIYGAIIGSEIDVTVSEEVKEIMGRLVSGEQPRAGELKAEPDEFDLAMDSALDGVFGPDPGKKPAKPKAVAVGPRGQYAIPGMESATEEIENREAEFGKFEPFVEDIRKISDDELAGKFRQGIRSVYPSVSRQLQRDGVIDYEDLTTKLADEMQDNPGYTRPSVQGFDVPDVVRDAAIQMVDQALAAAPGVKGFKRGDRVLYDQFDEGAEQYVVKDFGIEDGNVFASIRNKSGRTVEVELDDLQAAPRPARTLKDKADARKGKTSKKYQEKLDAFKKKAGIDGSTLRSGIDPELLTAAAELAAAAIDDKISTFAQFIARVAEDIGIQNTKDFSRYFEKVWDRLGQRSDFSHIDKAGRVADVLGESDGNTTSSNKTGKSDQPVDGSGSGRKGKGNRGGVGKGKTKGTRSDASTKDSESSNEGSGKTDVRDGSGTDQSGDAADGSTTDSGKGVRVDSRRGISNDFEITDEDKIGVSFGKKTKFRQNVNAIKLLKALEAEGRQATPEEQAELVQYVGWGGLKEAFSTKEDQWPAEQQELKELLDAAEYGDARRSVRNAHYTSPEVIRAMLDGLVKNEFKGGRILEPSVGVGHFFGLMPNSLMSESELHAVEMDSISARITRQLYPSANVIHSPYQEVSIPDGYYDLLISNVPFGEGPISDSFHPVLKKQKNSIHNFFFLKGLNNLRDGGVMAFVTSRYTMDGVAPGHLRLRRQIAEGGGRFIGAVRLPNNAFKGIASTSVTTDVIFIQKNAGKNSEWQDASGFGGFKINEYYHEHPENLLGVHREGAGQNPGEFGLAPDGHDIGKELAAAIAAMPFDKKAMGRKSANESTGEVDERLVSERVQYDDKIHQKMKLKQGWTGIRNGKLFRLEGQHLVEKPIPYPRSKAGTLKRIRGMDKIRRVRRQLMELEDAVDSNEKDIEALRVELNAVYDQYVDKNGWLNSVYNRASFKHDDDVFLLAGLELWDSDTKTATKTDIFTKRMGMPYSEPTSADTPRDAALLSLAQRGEVDIPYFAKLMGIPESAAIERLEGLAYEDPDSGKWTMGFQYLSGNIREKLAKAEAAAKKDSRFTTNVDALKKILPLAKTQTDIKPRLNSQFVPVERLQEFAAHITGASLDSIQVDRIEVNGRFSVTIGRGDDQKSRVDFGTQSRPSYDLFDRILNNAPLTVYYPQRRGERRVPNRTATAEAERKAKLIKEEFSKWIYSDPKRAASVVDSFNDTFNVYVEQESDGSHLLDPQTGAMIGSNQNIKLRPHQLASVWRHISDGNELLAHEVGLGKTFIMAAAAMEKKRLGLAKKQMVVVPNHLIEQFPREFKLMYPNAKILAPTSDQFNPAGRRQLLERIRNGDWDAIIVPMSSFKRIPMSPEYVTEKFGKHLSELEEAIRKARAASGRENQNYVAELEAAKARLEGYLDKMLNESEKDAGPFFDEIGIDGLIVDEAHEFKNLWFMTSMTRVAGVQNQGNQTTFDMWMKTDYLNELTNEKGILFATGTPISNSVGEMYTMQRYLQPKLLEESGLKSFDAWANTFGEVVTDIEVTPTGDGFRSHSRFKRFTNVKALSSMFRQVADVKFAKEVGLDKERPAMVGGAPQVIQVQPSLAMLEIVRGLSERMEDIRAGNREDNALNVTTDGRKAALDIRLINELHEDSLFSKLNVAAERIKSVYDRTTDNKGVQIVWMDMGVPKSDKKKKPSNDEENQLDSDDDQIEVSNIPLYQELKDKLIASGIKASEIAFIHDAGNDNAKRQKLFYRLNQGDVRVIVANTKRMATGANVQTRIAAMHHLDAPWKPADITQRDGRAIRQDNIYKDLGGVEVFRYITQGSFDAYIWQLLENKSGMINQIMLGDIDNTEDVGGAALSADEVKALASANPRVMDLVKLTSEQQTLELEQNAFNQQVNSWRQDVTWALESIKSEKESLERSIQVVESLPAVDEIEFELTVDGTKYTKFTEAGKALLDRILENEPKDGQTIARIHGMDVRWERVNKKTTAQLSLSFDGYTLSAGEWKGQLFDLSESDVGLATRIWNVVLHQFERPEIYRNRIKGHEQREQFATSNLKKNETWEKQEEYDDVTGRLDALRSEVGSSLREDRPITPLMKSARLAERLTKSTGRPIAGDARDPNNVVLVYGDGTKVDKKLIETERDQVDQETVRLLNDLPKPQMVTEDLFFNPKEYKSKAKSSEVKDTGVRRPASPEDDKGRQPPRDGNLGYSERSRGGSRPTGRRGPVTTPEEQSGEDAGPVSHTSVSRRLEKIWDATIKAGRVPASMLGSYQQSSGKVASPHVVRVIKAQIGNLGLLSHEIAHHIDQVTDVLDGLKNRAIWKELRGLDYKPGRADKKVARKEGFAEYVRMWMTAPDTGPNSAMMQAPQFTEYFEKWLKKHPDVAKKMTESRKQIRSYYNQSVEQRVASQIKESSTGDRPADETALELLIDKTTGWKENFEKDFVNQYAPVKKLMKLMKESGYKWSANESSTYDLLMAFTNASPQHAERAVQYGIHTVSKNDRILGRGLVTIVADSGVKEGKDYESAIRWIYARHAEELHSRKPEYNAGITVEDAQQILADTSAADAARYAKLGDGLTEFSNQSIAMLVDAGVISQEEADAIIEAGGEFYVPLIRVTDESQAKSLGGGGLINMGKPLKRRSTKGSDAPIMDPILSMLNRTQHFYSTALKQQVVQQLATEIRGTEGAGSLMHEVLPNKKVTAVRVADILADKTVQAEMARVGIVPSMYDGNDDLMTAIVNIFRPDVSGNKDENVVRLMVDGKPKLYWMNPALYESLDGMPDIMRHPFIKILGGFTRAVRMGAVGLNPVFAAANVQRDWRSFQERSRNTSGIETATSPFYWLGSYVKHASGKGGKNEMARLYEEFGGLLATRFGTGDRQSVDIRDISLNLSPEKKSTSLIHRTRLKASRYGQKVENFVAMADVGPRLAEFAGVLKKHGFIQVNGVIVDTNNGNKPGRPPRHVMVEAINAASEATVNFKIKGRKAQILNQMIPFLTASIASLNKQYRVVRGAYENDPTEANRMKVVMANAGAAALTVVYMMMRGDDDDYEEQPDWLKYGYWTFTMDGKPLFRLSKGYEESFVPNAVEGIINSMNSGSREDFLDSMYQTFHKTMLPYEMAAIAGPAEVAMNYDTFRQQPIENQSLTGRSTVNRSNEWTSEFAKALSTYGGQYIGLSPVEIDHLMGKQTGGLLPKVVGGVEGVLTGDTQKMSRAVEVLNPFSAFHVRKDYTRSINDVYERQTELNQKLGDLKFKGQEPTVELKEERSKLSRVTRLFSSLRDVVDAERDRDERFKVEQYMTGLARWATGERDLERYPNPWKLKDMPADVKAVIEDEMMKVIEHSIIESTSKNESYRQSIESARSFLKESGVSSAQAMTLLSQHYRSKPLSRDRYIRDQQIRDRRDKRALLMRMMK